MRKVGQGWFSVLQRDTPRKSEFGFCVSPLRVIAAQVEPNAHLRVCQQVFTIGTRSRWGLLVDESDEHVGAAQEEAHVHVHVIDCSVCDWIPRFRCPASYACILSSLSLSVPLSLLLTLSLFLSQASISQSRSLSCTAGGRTVVGKVKRR